MVASFSGGPSTSSLAAFCPVAARSPVGDLVPGPIRSKFRRQIRAKGGRIDDLRPVGVADKCIFPVIRPMGGVLGGGKEPVDDLFPLRRCRIGKESSDDVRRWDRADEIDVHPPQPGSVVGRRRNGKTSLFPLLAERCVDLCGTCQGGRGRAGGTRRRWGRRRRRATAATRAEKNRAEDRESGSAFGIHGAESTVSRGAVFRFLAVRKCFFDAGARKGAS